MDILVMVKCIVITTVSKVWFAYNLCDSMRKE